MEKVKLTRKQADAIEMMKAKGAPLSEIVERHVHKDPLIVNDWNFLSNLPTDTLIRALYIGYEIEKTPEDMVREYYLQHWDEATPYARGVCDAIKETIDLLNIKISGVNAE